MMLPGSGAVVWRICWCTAGRAAGALSAPPVNTQLRRAEQPASVLAASQQVCLLAASTHAAESVCTCVVESNAHAYNVPPHTGKAKEEAERRARAAQQFLKQAGLNPDEREWQMLALLCCCFTCGVAVGMCSGF